MRQHDTYDAALMQYPNLYALLRKVREIYVTHNGLVMCARDPVFVDPAVGQIINEDAWWAVMATHVSDLPDDKHTIGQELQCISWMAHCEELSDSDLTMLDQWASSVLKIVIRLSEEYDQDIAAAYREMEFLQ